MQYDKDMMSAAIHDLAWLAGHGALPGVTAVLAQRRRQIEQGYTTQHDADSRGDGWLLGEALQKSAVAGYMLKAGPVSGPDPSSACELAAEAAALLAAELDRMAVAVVPDGPEMRKLLGL